ncbi:DUF1573 domain-containing protein [Paenibacillus sp. YN15]|uniref:DUF1573 domain-containing protein n=1 Tax=Paenibacillus sp. YN15 TaxID=1742774 RepID=UPI000DCCE5B9|nr:DUF1573 domain-containing protein [Paenibacillus sp. YN15]RAU94564.1 DUF1573 domain-containing protein [Paenibacillus sp. YN15]
MSSPSLKEFQDQVGELLLRHRSVLDVLSKFQQSNAAANRAVMKSVTECGCIQVHAGKQNYTRDMTLEQAKEQLGTHLEGQVCENCKEVIASELGRNLFYMASLCNLLDLNLDKVVSQESTKCSTLGLFNLS